jgi:hypothetical protein
MGKRKKEKHITKKVRVIEDDIRIAFAEAERELAEQTCQKMRSVKHERGRYLVVLIAYPTRGGARSVVEVAECVQPGRPGHRVAVPGRFARCLARERL